MIKLYTLPSAFGLRSVSPFCLKAEMALTYLKLDFEVAFESDPRKAPKGKLPFLEVDGKIIADSELILDYLDQLTQGGLYGDLTAEESSRGFAYLRLAEDHLYWLMVASRWLDDAWWPNVKRDFFDVFPFPLRQLVPIIARRQVRQTYHLHGLGRHSLEEQQRFAEKDLQAIAATVAANHFIAGPRLTVFDFGVASILAGLMENEPDTWIGTMAKQQQPLLDYVARVQAAVGVYAREAPPNS